MNETSHKEHEKLRTIKSKELTTRNWLQSNVNHLNALGKPLTMQYNAQNYREVFKLLQAFVLTNLLHLPQVAH